MKKITVVIIYVCLILIQLCFFTPYTKEETRISNQNVPHTITLEKGFKNYFKIVGTERKEENTIIITETLLYPVAVFQFLITTGFTTFLYYTSVKSTSIGSLHSGTKNIDPPTFDINSLAFADEETQKEACERYALDIKKFWIKKFCPWIISIMILFIATCIVIGNHFYNKGFQDNQAYAPDGSPIVIITKNGEKYHKKNCRYAENGIEISTIHAEKQKFSPCSVCNP